MSESSTPGTRAAVVWTALVVLLTIGLVAAVAFRSRNPEEPPALSRRTRISDESTTAPDPAPAQNAAAHALPQGGPPMNRRSWREGYREAPAGDARATLSGRVLTPAGPARFQEVFVEWVLTFGSELPREPRDLVVRVDPEGTRWMRKTVTTDREGAFSLSGVPSVQLRVQIGRKVVALHAATDVRIEAGEPP